HGVAELLPESPGLALAAVAEYHRYPALTRRGFQHPNLSRLKLPPACEHPFRNPAQGIVTWSALDHDPIFLFDMVTRVHHSPGQLTIVGEQQETAAIEVQPANREETRAPGWQPIGHRLAAAIVTDAGQHPARIVHLLVGRLQLPFARSSVD